MITILSTLRGFIGTAEIPERWKLMCCDGQDAVEVEQEEGEKE